MIACKPHLQNSINDLKTGYKREIERLKKEIAGKDNIIQQLKGLVKSLESKDAVIVELVNGSFNVHIQMKNEDNIKILTSKAEEIIYNILTGK